MVSEITIKITLGPQATTLAEGSGGYAMVEAIPHPPDVFESSIMTVYDIPPVPDAVEESGGKFPEIPAPGFENESTSSSITKVRPIDEIPPPE